jgi:lysophospholipase L1-like esterase
MRVLMLGDSHLQRLAPIQRLIAPQVVNRAVGGAIAPEMLTQLGDLDPSSFDAVVFCVGTNDAGTRPVPLADFTAAVQALLDRVADTPTVFVSSPGADARAVDYDDASMASYAAAAAALVHATGGRLVDTPAVLAPLGRAGRVPDGLHVSKAGHALFVPAIRRAVRRTRS